MSMGERVGVCVCILCVNNDVNKYAMKQYLKSLIKVILPFFHLQSSNEKLFSQNHPKCVHENVSQKGLKHQLLDPKNEGIWVHK